MVALRQQWIFADTQSQFIVLDQTDRHHEKKSSSRQWMAELVTRGEEVGWLWVGHHHYYVRAARVLERCTGRCVSSYRLGGKHQSTSGSCTGVRWHGLQDSYRPNVTLKIVKLDNKLYFLEEMQTKGLPCKTIS